MPAVVCAAAIMITVSGCGRTGDEEGSTAATRGTSDSAGLLMNASPTTDDAPTAGTSLSSTDESAAPGTGTSGTSTPPSTGAASTATDASAQSDPEQQQSSIGESSDRIAEPTTIPPAAESNANVSLDDFGDWLRAQPGIDQSGYIQSVDDLSTVSTVLIWYGTSPLQDAATAEAARRGITATVREWPYSASALEAAALALYDRTDAFADVGFSVTDISAIPPDFAGVDLCGEFDNSQAPDEDAVRTVAASITDIPVRIDANCETPSS